MYKIALLFLLLPIKSIVFSQNTGNGDLQKKQVIDTILQKRTLLLPGAFDGIKALRSLFPGKYYDLTKKSGYDNKLTNWGCNTCKSKKYTDVNAMVFEGLGIDSRQTFPYENGVATRLVNVIDMIDANGGTYKMVAFNHSEFDSDGFQTGRFIGGLLGLAKFAKTDSGWLLRSYQPAIAAYGAFSKCPDIEPTLIGVDQYAFLIKHNNGAAGGPYNEAYFLLVGIDGHYKQQLAAYNVEQSNTTSTHWKSKLSVPETNRKYFRDIIITVTGVYFQDDETGFPPELLHKVKGIRSCSFSFSRRFVYTAAKGYEQQESNDILLTNLMR